MSALSHVLHGPFTVPQAVWKRELVLAEGSRDLPMTIQPRLQMIRALSSYCPQQQEEDYTERREAEAAST
jgi:hypothetical protein